MPVFKVDIGKTHAVFCQGIAGLDAVVRAFVAILQSTVVMAPSGRGAGSKVASTVNDISDINACPLT